MAGKEFRRPVRLLDITKERDEMANPILLPMKALGWAAAGFVAGTAGWKLGVYLAEVALGEKESPLDRVSQVLDGLKPQDPLWKRKFEPIS
jgi:hypothetical protein